MAATWPACGCWARNTPDNLSVSESANMFNIYRLNLLNICIKNMLIAVHYCIKICGINQAQNQVTWSDLLHQHMSMLTSFLEWSVASTWSRPEIGAFSRDQTHPLGYCRCRYLDCYFWPHHIYGPPKGNTDDPAIHHGWSFRLPRIFNFGQHWSSDMIVAGLSYDLTVMCHLSAKIWGPRGERD